MGFVSWLILLHWCQHPKNFARDKFHENAGHLLFDARHLVIVNTITRYVNSSKTGKFLCVAGRGSSTKFVTLLGIRDVCHVRYEKGV